MDCNFIQLHYQAMSKWNFNMLRGVGLNSILNVGLHLVMKHGYCQTLLLKNVMKKSPSKVKSPRNSKTKSRFWQFSMPTPFVTYAHWRTQIDWIAWFFHLMWFEGQVFFSQLVGQWNKSWVGFLFCCTICFQTFETLKT
jgi:hypothetical protein